jgi:hypothetical protein
MNDPLARTREVQADLLAWLHDCGKPSAADKLQHAWDVGAEAGTIAATKYADNPYQDPMYRWAWWHGLDIGRRIRRLVYERDQEWLDALHPGCRRTSITRAFATPQAYAPFAEAQRELERETDDDIRLLKYRLALKRQETAELRQRISELLREADHLRGAVPAQASRRSG